MEQNNAAAHRVALMHAQTRRGLLVSGGFGCLALAAAFRTTTLGPWLPLHLFLIGSVTSAIVAVTLMMAVTWSGAPAPRPSMMVTQRWSVALGTLLVVAGRESGHTSITVVGAGLVAAALLLGIAMLVAVRRTARAPRFSAAIDAYTLAFAAATGGAAIGGALAATTVTTDLRDAHVLLNLYAFVGVVIAGTLPSFTATQARTKMSPRATPRHLRALIGALWGTAVLAAVGVSIGERLVAGSLLVVHGAAFLTVAALLPRLGRKQLDWAGPRLAQLFCGVAWWGVMTITIGLRFDRFLLDRSPVIALVVGGLAQILVASYAYLVPVVRGGGHRSLSANFTRTRSPIGLVVANVAAVAALTGHDAVLLVALGIWGLDTLVRLAIVAQRRQAAAKPAA